ncbi:DUF4863 family protein [uncultured Sphingosinicella sp.]|jgi:hypothetical protein|uniref:4-hydroxylaminobenzoate lyase n=1 Tax=uncultured Sphingosinicella sp. TaxID=478748 RepID=UPI0030DD0D76|tara:strand:+ start:13309 stop:13794 length:486 start_codon:yes stop_codon:yes gene_type:complete
MTTSAPAVPAEFVTLVAKVTARIDGRPIEPALTDLLNTEFPPDGPWFSAMEALCHRGCAEGWLCAREAGGIRFGRPVKPGEPTHGFSVDVVEMDDVVGPHHSHPNGEIDLVMPLDNKAAFDGVVKGWKVYGPGSAHHPTVSGGKALVLYLLPQGAIEFTRG